MLAHARHRPPLVALWRRIGWLAAELLVVFAGVYAAALVSDQRSARADEARRQYLYTALHEELSPVADYAPKLAAFTVGYLADFEAARAAGSRPVPEAFFYTPPYYPITTLSTLVGSEASRLFDVAFAARLAGLHTAFASLMATEAKITALGEQWLLPSQPAGPDAFYAADGTLRPRFQWYLRYIETRRRILESLNDPLVRLRADLDQRMDAAPDG